MKFDNRLKLLLEVVSLINDKAYYVQDDPEWKARILNALNGDIRGNLEWLLGQAIHNIILTRIEVNKDGYFNLELYSGEVYLMAGFLVDDMS